MQRRVFDNILAYSYNQVYLMDRYYSIIVTFSSIERNLLSIILHEF